jgi:CheY-like chemotaxis protein
MPSPDKPSEGVAALHSAEKPGSNSAGSRKSVVLCVDDELIPLSLRKLALEKAGYEVISASSGDEGLRIAASSKIDIVLSDYLMPSMSGTEFARRLKVKHPHMPFIIISGVNDIPSDMGGADQFVSKLNGPTAVFEAINAALSGARVKNSLPYEGAK